MCCMLKNLGLLKIIGAWFARGQVKPHDKFFAQGQFAVERRGDDLDDLFAWRQIAVNRLILSSAVFF